MVNKKVQKIIASFMVIGSLAGTIATSTTEAASRDYEHKHNQKINPAVKSSNQIEKSRPRIATS